MRRVDALTTGEGWIRSVRERNLIQGVVDVPVVVRKEEYSLLRLQPPQVSNINHDRLDGRTLPADAVFDIAPSLLQVLRVQAVNARPPVTRRALRVGGEESRDGRVRREVNVMRRNPIVLRDREKVVD